MVTDAGLTVDETAGDVKAKYEAYVAKITACDKNDTNTPTGDKNLATYWTAADGLKTCSEKTNLSDAIDDALLLKAQAQATAAVDDLFTTYGVSKPDVTDDNDTSDLKTTYVALITAINDCTALTGSSDDGTELDDYWTAAGGLVEDQTEVEAFILAISKTAAVKAVDARVGDADVVTASDLKDAYDAVINAINGCTALAGDKDDETELDQFWTLDGGLVDSQTKIAALIAELAKLPTE